MLQRAFVHGMGWVLCCAVKDDKFTYYLCTWVSAWLLSKGPRKRKKANDRRRVLFMEYKTYAVLFETILYDETFNQQYNSHLSGWGERTARAFRTRTVAHRFVVLRGASDLQSCTAVGGYYCTRGRAGLCVHNVYDTYFSPPPRCARVVSVPNGRFSREVEGGGGRHSNRKLRIYKRDIVPGTIYTAERSGSSVRVVLGTAPIYLHIRTYVLTCVLFCRDRERETDHHTPKTDHHTPKQSEAKHLRKRVSKNN